MISQDSGLTNLLLISQLSFIGKSYILDQRLLAAGLKLQFHRWTYLPPLPWLTHQTVRIWPKVDLERTKCRHEDRRACLFLIHKHNSHPLSRAYPAKTDPIVVPGVSINSDRRLVRFSICWNRSATTRRLGLSFQIQQEHTPRLGAFKRKTLLPANPKDISDTRVRVAAREYTTWLQEAFLTRCSPKARRAILVYRFP